MKQIIIAPYSYHRFLLKKYRKDNPLFDVKMYTKESLLEAYFGFFDEGAVYKMMKENNVTYEHALYCVDSMPFIHHESNPKLKELLKIKTTLINEGHFGKNFYLRQEIEKCNALIYGYSDDDRLLKYMLDHYEINYEFNKNSLDLITSDIIVFDSRSDEVLYVLNKIASMISSGVNPSDIYLYNVNDDTYKTLLKIYAPSFNIKINNLYENPLYFTGFSTEFFKKYNEENDPLDVIEEMKERYQDDELFNVFSEIIEKYKVEGISYNAQKDIYSNKLKNKKIKGSYYKNAITIIDEPIGEEEKHIFVLNFSTDYPATFADSEYLTDSEKKGTFLESTSEKNDHERKVSLSFLNSNNHFYYSIPDRADGRKVYPSSFVKDKKKQLIHVPIDNSIYSLVFADAICSQKNDLLIKYKEVSEDLSIGKYIESEYGNYDNEYHYVNVNKEKGIPTFSYSSYSEMNSCPFSFYLNRVLNLDDNSYSFFLTFGNLAHKILEKIYDDDFDFDKEYERVSKEKDYQFELVDTALLPKLKNNLKETCQYVRNHYFKNILSNDKSSIREQEFYYDLSNTIKLYGRLDKVVVVDDYYFIVDYKTGDYTFKSKNVQFGNDAQLPIYSLLAKQREELKNKKLAGVYINTLIRKDLKVDKDEMDKVCPKYAKLSGVTLTDIDFKKIDCSFSDDGKSADYITTNKNSLLSRETFEQYKEIIKEKIALAADRYKTNQFDIRPLFTKDIDSCKYCPYHDVCYVTIKQRYYAEEIEEREDYLDEVL